MFAYRFFYFNELPSRSKLRSIKLKEEIKCTKCGQWFKSGIQFGDSKNFFTSNLIENLQKCGSCGEMTGCNKENMRFSERADEGWLKTHFEGQEAFE